MSCYFRHIKDIFEEAGIEVTPATKKDVDRAIHKLVGVQYKDCPATWRQVKQQFLADDKKRMQFVQKLKRALK
jgi:hypothetical protein